MFKIVRPPSKLKSFFSDLEAAGYLRARQFQHAMYFMLGLLVTGYRKTVTGIARAIHGGVHRAKRNEFLTQSRWDEAGLLTWLAFRQLKRLGLRAGETLYLIFDDTHVAKRGKKIQGAGKYRDTACGFLWGHNIFAAVLHYRGFTIPLHFRIHLKPPAARDFGKPFATLPEMAADLIRATCIPEEINVVVLFDSGYMSKKVVRAVQEKGFTYVSVLPANRKIKINGRITRLGHYRRCIPHGQHRAVKIVRHKGRTRTFWATSRDAWIPAIGRVTLVFSRRRKGETALPLVTNERSWSRKRIIQTYEIRWAIEQFFKDTKQHLGLGEYQTSKYAGAVTHLHLVGMAYSLLVDQAITAQERRRGKKRGNRNGALVSWSLLQLRDEVRGFVVEDVLDYIAEQPDPRRAIAELRQMMRAA